MNREKVRDVLSANPKYELVEHDLCNIADRIRKIDPSYYIVFNKRNGRYEVHSTDNIGASFCFLVPYDELDARTLVYCRETRVERDVIERVDRLNSYAEKSRDRTRRSEYRYRAEEMADHVKRAVQNETLSPGYTDTHYIRRAY